MPELDTPVTCNACGKSYVRTGGPQRYCQTCLAGPRCGRCKYPEKAGHGPKCPLASGSAGGARGKRLARPTGDGAAEKDARAAAQLLLGYLRTVRERLDKRIANVEDLVGLL
jgi:hypothetical protein